MRTSKYLLATTKETPADAVVISHQLMLKAGLIRKLASGLYNWLPMGLRVLHKVTQIIREEMDNSGALEVSMTAESGSAKHDAGSFRGESLRDGAADPAARTGDECVLPVAASHLVVSQVSNGFSWRIHARTFRGHDTARQI